MEVESANSRPPPVFSPFRTPDESVHFFWHGGNKAFSPLPDFPPTWLRTDLGCFPPLGLYETAGILSGFYEVRNNSKLFSSHFFFLCFLHHRKDSGSNILVSFFVFPPTLSGYFSFFAAPSV